VAKDKLLSALKLNQGMLVTLLVLMVTLMVALWAARPRR